MLDQTISLQRQNLLGRLAPGTPHAEFFREIVNGAFDIAARFGNERDRIARDRNLSDEGKRTMIANLVTGDIAVALAQGPAQRAGRAAAHNASRKAAIGKPTFDPTDLASAHERAEVRSYLRAIPDDGRRLQAACELATDAGAAQAILSGPHTRLTGLTSDQFDRVQGIYLSHHHADELAEVEAMQADVDVLLAAVELSLRQVSGVSGMDERRWAEFWTALKGANA